MANIPIDWSDSISVQNNYILIRGDKSRDWPSSLSFTFTLDEAEDMADYVKAQVDKARRESPEVQELVSHLEEADFSKSGATLEDIALALYRKGYRKQ